MNKHFPWFLAALLSAGAWAASPQDLPQLTGTFTLAAIEPSAAGVNLLRFVSKGGADPSVILLAQATISTALVPGLSYDLTALQLSRRSVREYQAEGVLLQLPQPLGPPAPLWLLAPGFQGDPFAAVGYMHMALPEAGAILFL